MFVKKSNSRKRTGKLYLQRPLKSQDLKFAYFNQLNLQKITRVHVLRADCQKPYMQLKMQQI